jgi:predicted nucleic acid-binding protein
MADKVGLVLDSSAALAVLLGEPDGVAIRQHLAEAAGQPIYVLDLFWLEVVNVLIRGRGWDPDGVVEALRELDELGVETVPLDRPLLLAALDLGTGNGITAYDAAHLALAQAAGVRLLTLDRALARAAGDRTSSVPRRATHETPGVYSGEARRPDWARHGRYLAELRRAAGA